jgi:hypothetical protein
LRCTHTRSSTTPQRHPRRPSALPPW